MTTAIALVDAEATARTWARANAGITAAVAGRIFFSTPQAYATAPAASWVVLSLVGEVHDPGELGLQKSLIQFDCWGNTKANAATVVLAIQTAARALALGAPQTVGTATIAWGDVQQRRWLPDPVTNTARYVLDVLFALRGVDV